MNNSNIKPKPRLSIKKANLIANFFEKIEDTYKFVNEIGEGAFGKVYLIENKKTKQRFACKRLSKKKIKNKDSLQREIEMMKDLDHPNIVKLIEVYEDKAYIFLVMEELKGGELFERILARAKGNNYYTEREVAVLFKQIVSGIAYCHEINIVHRDIKPDNIIFVDEKEDSNVKIIDFGLGRSFDKILSMKTRVGTCDYMSPEVLKGEYNEKCDVWSLGVLLYILISGRPPFKGDTETITMKKITEGKFEFKWEGWGIISNECKKLISDMLTVDINKRPTAREVLQNLWVSTGASKANDIPIKVNLDDIKQYTQINKFSKAVSGFMALRLTESNVKELSNMFKSLDKDGNGSINICEFEKGFKKFCETKIVKITDEEHKQFFDAIDLDNSGTITYNEFIAATFEKKKQKTKEQVYQALKAFDTDKDGDINFEEFKKIITAHSEEEVKELKSLFDVIDKNGDGRIDFTELYDNLGD